MSASPIHAPRTSQRQQLAELTAAYPWDRRAGPGLREATGRLLVVMDRMATRLARTGEAIRQSEELLEQVWATRTPRPPGLAILPIAPS